MRYMSSIFTTGLLAGLVAAIPNAQPAPTNAKHNLMDLNHGYSPNPTKAPSLELIKKRAPYLYERAATLSSGQLVGYFAPDSQCGYISGSIGAPIPCSTGSRCAAIAPIGNLPGAVGCCPIGQSGCYFITTCYNSAEIAASKCDHGCQQDSDVRLCAQSTRPYCYGYTWPDISATIWGCDSVSVTTKDTVRFTFNGESPTRSWSAFYYTPSGTDTASGIITDVTGRVGSASQQSPSASSSPTVTPSSKSNTGAIVGGVVGGIGVIAAFAFGIFFLLMRKRKNKKEAAAAQTAANQPPGPPPGMQQQQIYDPNQPSPHHLNAVPVGGAAGYYSQENKQQTISELGSPGHSPTPNYTQAVKYDPNSPYQQDPRMSTYSEASHNPVPPYHGPPPHLQPPMELDATSVAPHTIPQGQPSYQGQPVYEAPAHVPGQR